jgi:hypothetical protein
MALSNYEELKSSIASWINRSDLTAQIPDFISLAEAQINRRLRVRQMVTRAEATVNAEFISAPADMLEPIHLAIEISESDIRALKYMAHERLLEEKQGSTATGEPQIYTLAGNTLQFYPTPDQSYTAELTYYAKIPSLALASTNWLLTEHPDAYLFGSLMQSAPYLVDDERIGTWGALFNATLEAIEMSNRIPGGRLRTGLLPLIGRQTFNIETGM